MIRIQLKHLLSHYNCSKNARLEGIAWKALMKKIDFTYKIIISICKNGK